MTRQYGERLREREKGPNGNNHGMFQKCWADHDYHEDGGESIAMVQNRNIEALDEILSDNVGKQEHCHVEKEFKGKRRADKK